MHSEAHLTQAEELEFVGYLFKQRVKDAILRAPRPEKPRRIRKRWASLLPPGRMESLMYERVYRLAAAITGFLPLSSAGEMKVVIPRGALVRVTPDPYDSSGSLQVSFANDKTCRVDVAVINRLDSALAFAT